MRWILPPHRQRARRPGQRGQGLVEFSLVGGLFFFLVFSIVNAGFFLYGRGAVEHAADVGVALISTEGNCMAYTPGGLCEPLAASCPNAAQAATADQVAICAMDQQGFNSAPLTTVTQIVIWKVAQQGDGSFATVTSGCSGPCEDIYAQNGTASLSNWLPGGRTVVGSPDFAELQITYHYSLLATTGGFTLTTDNLFRLEPQP
ncbi:MAG: TadE/TadG family type IV pilus assembly protein [Candidatus Dormibacteria bacterium]